VTGSILSYRDIYIKQRRQLLHPLRELGSSIWLWFPSVQDDTTNTFCGLTGFTAPWLLQHKQPHYRNAFMAQTYTSRCFCSQLFPYMSVQSLGIPELRYLWRVQSLPEIIFTGNRGSNPLKSSGNYMSQLSEQPVTLYFVCMSFIWFSL
jgi:hypothetical protein